MSAASPIDPWVVQAPKQMAQASDGFHVAVFAGVEPFALPSNGDPKWRFNWTVKTGPETGKVASALTDCSISPATLPGRLISGLLGRPLTPGEDVRAAVDACVGKTFMVTVSPGPKGGKSGVKVCGQPPQM